MLIQARDREILRVCYEQQFLTLEHVEEFFFKGKLKRRARERVQELEQAGLLQKSKYPALGFRRLIRLTKAGVSVAKSVDPAEIPQARHLDPETLMHDALVTSARLRLQEFWDFTFIPERSLKVEEYPRIPDGILLFGSGRKIAIELENSAKGRARYLKIFESWKGMSVVLVLYVATTPRLFEMLKGYLPLAPQEVAFGLVLLDDLMKGTPRVWTPKGELDLLSRREF